MKAIRSFFDKYREEFQARDDTQNGPSNPPAQTDGAYDAPAAAPQGDPQQQVLAAAAPGTLQIRLQNKTNSNTVYAYVTGLALERNNTPAFVQSDGQTIYYPTAPTTILQPLQADVAIPLGAPGNVVNVRIPKIAGGRIWFSIGAKLTFKLNPGPAVVEPSVTNPSDENYNINWGFVEFTYDDTQLFANISYVDFVSVPLALTLTSTMGDTQSVPGMVPNGLSQIATALRAQAKADGRPWDQLVHSVNGQPLRVISPNNLLVWNPNAWSNYWDGYVQAVWNKYSDTDIIINTQAAAGNLRGRVRNNVIDMGVAGTFEKPSARDIFTCNTGPFATGANRTRNTVIPRLSAAFNRSTLLNAGVQFPNSATVKDYYQDPTTNHYARIVHAAQKDGRGYAFPYDDVVPDGGQDVAGTVFMGNPQLFTVAVGGQ